MTRRRIAPATDTPMSDHARSVAADPAPAASVRLGRWEEALSDVKPDTVIVDAPYSERTHKGALSSDVNLPTGNARTDITYAWWTALEIGAFVDSWAPRTSCWMVSITDTDLAPLWRAAYERADLYAFPPLGIVISGMGVRILADGPASWTLHLMVARRKGMGLSTAPGAESKIWRSLPGGYTGPATADMAGGRGKPRWLLDALVRDYSDPGMLVVDPCAGWGSTLVAARNAGRRAIGAELDPAAFARCEHALTGDMAAYARAAPLRASVPDPVRPGLFDSLPPAVPVAPRKPVPAPTGRGSGKSQHSASGGKPPPYEGTS